eukprot:TRINITY_DN1570_c0_g2_i6.p1 TRINITY_DN1570_c0_g2~~TRINITY_DN1570_c0_g2_i6.p1  ORF type:complete len:223 (-),score=51.45 TRINITY_DN1570_c0_g2_i6:71-739(-)
MPLIFSCLGFIATTVGRVASYVVPKLAAGLVSPATNWLGAQLRKATAARFIVHSTQHAIYRYFSATTAAASETISDNKTTETTAIAATTERAATNSAPATNIQPTTTIIGTVTAFIKSLEMDRWTFALKLAKTALLHALAGCSTPAALWLIAAYTTGVLAKRGAVALWPWWLELREAPIGKRELIVWNKLTAMWHAVTDNPIKLYCSLLVRAAVHALRLVAF